MIGAGLFDQEGSDRPILARQEISDPTQRKRLTHVELSCIFSEPPSGAAQRKRCAGCMTVEDMREQGTPTGVSIGPLPLVVSRVLNGEL